MDNPDGIARQSEVTQPAQSHNTATPQIEPPLSPPVTSSGPSAIQQTSGVTFNAPSRQGTGLSALEEAPASGFWLAPRRLAGHGFLGENEPWDYKNILSLGRLLVNGNEIKLICTDGGGIRGYYSLLILKQLMMTIQQLELDYSDGRGVEAPAVTSFSPCIQPLNVCHSVISTDSDHQNNHKVFLPCHYFDYIAGTSTGGYVHNQQHRTILTRAYINNRLIAIMLSRLRMSVDDCIHEYLELGGKVFGKPRHLYALVLPVWRFKRTKYDADVLKKVIEDVANRHGRRDDAKLFESEEGLCQTLVVQPLLAPCNLVNSHCASLAFAYKEIDKNERQVLSVEKPYIFRSFDHHSRVHPDTPSEYPRNPGKAAQQQIWEVARATTAAPLFFDPIKLSGIPSERHVGRRTTTATTATAADTRRRPNASPMATFVDGGYGEANNPAEEAYYEVKTFNDNVGTFVSIGTARRFTNRFNSGVRSTARAAFDALGDPEQAHIKMESLSGRFGFSYFRFNEQDALATTEFDEWNPKSSGRKTQDKILRAFQEWFMHPHIQMQFQNCARELVRRRRLRTADTSRWERHALGSCFDCKENCKETGNRRWKYRAEFEDHLRSAQHQVTPNRPIDQIVQESRTLWAYKRRD
jgi:hypothetical protein